jgi:membrane protease YdiL (CAAX protease family)
MNARVTSENRHARFEFAGHPWISLITFWVLASVLIFLFAILGNLNGLVDSYAGFIIMVAIVTPMVMRIPRTKRSFSDHLEVVREGKEGSRIKFAILAVFSYYRDYLDVIRLTRIQPVILLLLLGLSCWAILALSQAAGTIVFRLTQNEPLTAEFILATLNLEEDLPPQSMSLLTSFKSVFEEIAWRGIFLTLFLAFYSRRKSVIFAAFGFSALHILNLTGDSPTIWVIGQLAWSFILGLWYGYSVIKTDSLIPAMMVHWLGNTFIYSINNYIQHNATPEAQALYGVTFMFGIVPTILLFLWVRYVSAKWPVFREVKSSV